uniref:Uncharacterized protein n=1 Tax=Populus trichocarpa TaxID=3694 RepID=A0A2K1YF52_POPTR
MSNISHLDHLQNKCSRSSWVFSWPWGSSPDTVLCMQEDAMRRHSITLAIIHIVQLQRLAISVIVTSFTEHCPSSTSKAKSGNLSDFLKRNAGCFGEGISVSLLNIKTTVNHSLEKHCCCWWTG